MRWAVLIVALAACANDVPAGSRPEAGRAGLTSRIEVRPPALDVAALHERWQRLHFPGVSCTWPTMAVGAGRGFASIADALAAARADPSACGPTVALAGRDPSPSIEITQPTILVGESGAEITATVWSTRGQPLWLQDVSLVDAPYPGALFVAHPGAETTLVSVTVERAQGFGLVHQGGLLSAWSTEVRDVRTAKSPRGLVRARLAA